MVDYYVELGLDRSLGLDELNRQLSKSEGVWKARRTRVPEKATKMLALVVDAREVFANSNSRSAYDRELDAAKNDSGQADENSTDAYPPQFVKWRSRANEYRDQGEWDLAAMSLNKAIAVLGGQEADVDFYCMASEIFTSYGDARMGLQYANEAILADPHNYEPYYRKAIAYDAVRCAESDSGLSGSEARAYEACSAMRESLIKAAEAARQSGDSESQGTMLGVYAFTLSSFNPLDITTAEAIARQAVELGDRFGNAQRVIADIETKKEEERQRELEQTRIEAELRRRQEVERAEQARIDSKVEAVKKTYFHSTKRVANFDSYARTIASFELAMQDDQSYFEGHSGETNRYLAAIETVSKYDLLSLTAMRLRSKLKLAKR